MYKLFVIVSIFLSSICYGKEKYLDYEKYSYQEPKQIDCQKIVIDNSDYGGKSIQPRICFYEVTFGDPQRTVLMWKNIDTNDYGFVEK